MLEDLGSLSRNTPLKREGVRSILTSSQLLQLDVRLRLSVVNHGSPFGSPWATAEDWARL